MSTNSSNAVFHTAIICHVNSRPKNNKAPFVIAKLRDDTEVFMLFTARKDVLPPEKDDEPSFGSGFRDHWFDVGVTIVCLVVPGNDQRQKAIAWAPTSAWEKAKKSSQKKSSPGAGQALSDLPTVEELPPRVKPTAIRVDFDKKDKRQFRLLRPRASGIGSIQIDFGTLLQLAEKKESDPRRSDADLFLQVREKGAWVDLSNNPLSHVECKIMSIAA